MARKKKRKFPYKEAVLVGGAVGAGSAVAPQAMPAFAILTPMAYHWYKTRPKLKHKKKLKRVM